MVLPIYWLTPGKHTFVYQARAVSEGQFVAPPATASLMYSPEVYGRSGVDQVNIIHSSAGFIQKLNNSIISAFGKKYVKLVYWIIAILVLAIAAGIVWLAFRYNKKKNSIKNNTTSESPPQDPPSPNEENKP
jgi:hypothetical protein